MKSIDLYRVGVRIMGTYIFLTLFLFYDFINAMSIIISFGLSLLVLILGLFVLFSIAFFVVI